MDTTTIFKDLTDYILQHKKGDKFSVDGFDAIFVGAGSEIWMMVYHGKNEKRKLIVDCQVKGKEMKYFMVNDVPKFLEFIRKL